MGDLHPPSRLDPDGGVGQAFALAWADAIVRYWEIGLAAGLVDPTQSVLVLEPDAGDGLLARQMHEALHEQLRDSLGEGLQVLYLACAPDPAGLARLRANPWLAAQGGADRNAALETDLWPPRRERTALGLNPPVILARRWPQALWPELDLLARWSGGRYLLLAAGSAPGGSDLTPLAAALERAGVQVWLESAATEGAALLAALRDERARAGVLAAVALRLARQRPEDGLHLAALLRAASAPPDQTRMLALLRLSGHDPLVLEAALEALERVASEDLRREAWCEALARAWSRYPAARAQPALPALAARHAVRLGHWGLAKSILRLALGLEGERAEWLDLLSRYEQETGDARAALVRAERALAREPTPARRARRDELAAGIAAWHALAWYDPDQARDGEWRLEPPIPARSGTDLVLCHTDWGEQAEAVWRVAGADPDLTWRALENRHPAGAMAPVWPPALESLSTLTGRRHVSV